MCYTSAVKPHSQDMYHEPAVSEVPNDKAISGEGLLALFRSRYPVKQWEENGYFTEPDLLTINPHWLQFLPPTPANHFFLAVLYVIVFLVGCFSNLLVIYILASNRNLRTPPNLLVMNLAVSDFVMLIKMPIFLYNSFLQGPALGQWGCNVYGFLGGLTGTASILTLAAVASDRYRVISSPLNLDRKTTKSRALLLVIVIWVYSAFFSSLPFFGIGRYVPEGYLTSCSFDYLAQDDTTRIFIVVFFIAAWVVPFTIITLCYTAIICAVSKHNRGIAACNREDQRGTQAKVRADVQRTAELTITRTVFGLIIVWLLAWTPYATVALLAVSGRRDLVTPLASMIPALFCKISAVINPYMYSLRHPKIKREIFTRFQRLFASNDINSVSESYRLKWKAADVVSMYSASSLPASITQPHINVSANLGDLLKNSPQRTIWNEKGNSKHRCLHYSFSPLHHDNDTSLSRTETVTLKFMSEKEASFHVNGNQLIRGRSLPSLL